MAEVEYPPVGYGMAVALDEGTGSYNWAVLRESDTGYPVVVAAEGLDDNIDIALAPKGTGRVVMDVTSQGAYFPELVVGTQSTANTGNRRFTFYSFPTLTTGESVFRIGGGVNGTLGASLTGYFVTAMDSDTLKFSNTSNGMTLEYTGHTLSAGWSGGRTTQSTFLNIAGAGTAGDVSGGTNAYHVAGSSFAQSSASFGGNSGGTKGNLFARNDGATLLAGAGYHVNSIIGHEVDVGVRSGTEALYKVGHKLGIWNDDAVRGAIADYGYTQQLTPNITTSEGWRIGYALGGYEAWWPYTASSTLMKRVKTAGSISPGAPAYNLGQGIDFNEITFTESQLKGVGFKMDPAGNLGALTASGVALQTRSAITAKTAVVNTIAVVEGGLYAGAVTLTCSAPTTSGTTATATVATYSMRYMQEAGNRGTGYAEGDTFTVVGGTGTAASGIITVVSGGQVFGVKFTTVGNYSVLPAFPAATTTSGAGTGFTITPMVSILTVTVSGAGTNYSEFLPPTVASAGATATYREAVFNVTMTATQSALALNPGGGLTITASALGNYANDAAAAAGGVAVNGVYRNGSVVMVRVA